MKFMGVKERVGSSVDQVTEAARAFSNTMDTATKTLAAVTALAIVAVVLAVAALIIGRGPRT